LASQNALVLLTSESLYVTVSSSGDAVLTAPASRKASLITTSMYSLCCE
jgi:hypothetical protein